MPCYARTTLAWMGVGRPNSAYRMSLGEEAQTHEAMQLKGAAHATKFVQAA
jgi:hypothetical protein